MTTELDELDEINLGRNPTERPDKRLRTSRKNLATALDRFRDKPKWLRQLRARNGSSAQLKAKVTT